MRRTQLYLDDQLWGALQAVRERYFGDREQRRAAMQQFVGIRKSRSESADGIEEVRRLRRGSRLDRLRDQ